MTQSNVRSFHIVKFSIDDSQAIPSLFAADVYKSRGNELARGAGALRTVFVSNPTGPDPVLDLLTAVERRICARA